MLAILATTPNPERPDVPQRVRAAMDALHLTDMQRLRQLSPTTIADALALSRSLGWSDDNDWPRPWQDILRQVNDPELSVDDVYEWAITLHAWKRQDIARAYWNRLIGDESSSETNGEDIDRDDDSTIFALRALATLAPEIAQRVMRETETVEDAIACDALPMAWRVSDSRIAVRRAIAADLRREAHLIGMPWPSSQQSRIVVTRLPSETLPPNARQWLASRWALSSLCNPDARPWLDGQDAIFGLRNRGVAFPKICGFIALACNFKAGREWEGFLSVPSAKSLRPLLNHGQFWRNCAVVLSCLPKQERESAVQAIAEMPPGAGRDAWAIAAAWLWRDRRAERLIEYPASNLDELLPRLSDEFAARALSIVTPQADEREILAANAVSRKECFPALAAFLRSTLRLPAQAEEALRSMPQDEQTRIIRSILDEIPWDEMPMTRRLQVGRYVRRFGWNDTRAEMDLPSLLLAEDDEVSVSERDLQDDRLPTFAQQMSVSLPPSLWKEMARRISHGAPVADAWWALLLSVVPPPDTRPTRLDDVMRDYVTEAIQSTDGDRMLRALRRVECCAEHPTWSLSLAARRELCQMLDAEDVRQRYPWLAVPIAATLDALQQKHDSDRWQRALQQSPFKTNGEATWCAVRALIRWFHVMPIDVKRTTASWVYHRLLEPQRQILGSALTMITSDDKLAS